MNILQKFTDMGLYNIVNKIYMYIQSDIIIHTDIKNIINLWVHDIYNGNFEIKDCTEKEYNKIYYNYDTDDIYDTSDSDSVTPLMNFTNYYFARYRDNLICYEEMEHEIFLENAVEQFLCGCHNDEEYINGQYIEIDDSDFSDSD